MMLRPVLLIFLGFSLLQASGQVELEKPVKPVLYLKGEFLNLLNPVDPSVLVSLEYFPTGDHFSITHELGYVAEIRQYDNVAITRSFKTRHELRYYFHEAEGAGSALPYVAIDFQYRKLTVNERYVLGYECELGDCTYYRNYTGDFRTKRYAATLIGGLQYKLGKRVVLDTDYGVGGYQYNLNRSELEGGLLIENDRFLEEDKFGWRWYATAHIKLGYLIIGR